MDAKKIVAFYFGFQAVGIAAWWLMLWMFPQTVGWFHPQRWPDESLMSFWLADGLLLVGGSCLTTFAAWRKWPWASYVVWGVAVAVAYPTLYCIGASFLTGEAWIASAMMSCSAGLSLAMATIYGNTQQEPATLRATPMRPAVAFAWTLVQTAIFWSVFLVVIPLCILEIETYFGVSFFSHSLQAVAAVALFTAASALGIWSGFTMSFCGKGTPLPTASAPELVTAGPYRWLRNPMALSGISQGVAVGWFCGSFSVMGYALCGAVVWHLFVRPVEENDLAHRFGPAYQAYQDHVSLWIPRFRSRDSFNPNKPRHDS